MYAQLFIHYVTFHLVCLDVFLCVFHLFCVLSTILHGIALRFSACMEFNWVYGFFLFGRFFLFDQVNIYYGGRWNKIAFGADEITRKERETVIVNAIYVNVIGYLLGNTICWLHG